MAPIYQDGPFRPEDLARMREAALELLNDTGLWVQHKAARDVIGQYAGVRVNGEQVYLSPDLVRKIVPVPFGPGHTRHTGPLGIGIGGYCLKVRDLDTGRIRPPRLPDLIAALKLADSYDAEGAAPLTPSEFPSEVQQIAMYRYGWEYTRRVFGEVMTHMDIAEAIFEMTQAMGRTFRHFIYATSPLRIDASNLEMVRRFAPRGSEVWCCAMGIMGMTAPLPLSGAFVQSLAELMGLITVAKLFVPEARILGAEVFLSSMDMKSGNFSFARPENILVNRGAIQVMDYFGFDMPRDAWLHTSAKEIGVQSAMEKAARLGMMAGMGLDGATSLGMLGNDECFSFEQFVIDVELVRYCDRAIAGADFSEESLRLDAVREIGSQGNYLMHESTLGSWETAYRTDLFDYRTFQNWFDAGAPGVVDRAREIAKARIASHSYRLDAERLAAIDAIYRRTVGKFCPEALATG